jgi:hypothetical protein
MPDERTRRTLADMRRLLALVAAAAMVAGSIALRSRLDRNDEERANPVRVVCAAELGPVCDALRRTSAELTIEGASTTADRLSQAAGEDQGIDGWLVPVPWPQIVDGRRQRAFLPPLFADVGAPLARTPLVLVVQNALADVLRPRCGGTVGWKCLGDQAAPTGPARPRHSEPSSAFGALILGQATAAYFDKVAQLSTFELDDAGFGKWFQALERAAPTVASGGSPLEEMLGSRFATYNAVGTTEAEAAPVVGASALREQVTVLYPAPMATADVVLAGATGTAARRLRDGDAIRRALKDAGWRVDGAGPPGAPALPATNGLPSPGLLDALRERRP